MRKLVTLAVAGSVALLTGAPAQAATVTVNMSGFVYTPDLVVIAQGTTVAWHNGSARAIHTSTQDAPLAKWDTKDVTSGMTKSVTINWAGIYPYHCKYHVSLGMRGVVKVPIKVRPSTGSTSTTFTIRMASQAAPTGFAYDVQEKIGSGSWMSYRKGVTTASISFDPADPGAYSFRSRLRNTSTNAASGYSPKRTITVS